MQYIVTQFEAGPPQLLSRNFDMPDRASIPKPIWLAVCFFCGAITSHVAFAQPIYPQATKVDQAVNTLMEQRHLVGVAIGLIENDRVVYSKGYGKANIANAEQLSEQSILNWASNSKPVMAVLALQLVQEKLLDLDQPLAGYLPDLPEQLSKITTRQLLCHQSGIPHYTNGKVIPAEQHVHSDKELDPLVAINRFAKSPLIFESGTRTEYSSHAYVLLSAVVQSAGREPIAQQLERRITKPLGLASFQLDLPLESQTNWVKSYSRVDESHHEVPDYAHYWKHGAGGYKSNVRDFAAFALALMTGQLLSEEMTGQMWTRQKTLDARESNYGLGVVVEGAGRELKISHNGSQDETKTRMVLYPNRRLGVVVMCNTQPCDPSEISTAVLTSLKKVDSSPSR